VIGSLPSGIAEPGTDMAALADGYVSITPLRIDLTDQYTLSDLQTWQWDQIKQSKEKQVVVHPEPAVW
jgi:5'-nucleotidase